jgi:hypothetical protein
VQNTAVSSDALNPFWIFKGQAANLQKLKGPRLGKWQLLCYLPGVLSPPKAGLRSANTASSVMFVLSQAVRLSFKQKCMEMLLAYLHNAMPCVWLHVLAGGTGLQLPTWTVLKETIRSHNWTQFTQLGLPNMALSGPIGPLAYYFPRLTMLDLSYNQLTGVIPPDLSTLTGLLYINLANNNLYGKYPVLNCMEVNVKHDLSTCSCTTQVCYASFEVLEVLQCRHSYCVWGHSRFSLTQVALFWFCRWPAHQPDLSVCKRPSICLGSQQQQADRDPAGDMGQHSGAIQHIQHQQQQPLWVDPQQLGKSYGQQQQF